jgi:hypothetical protein
MKRITPVNYKFCNMHLNVLRFMCSQKNYNNARYKFMGPKTLSAPTKTGLAYKLCFIMFLPSCTVEAVEAPQTLPRAPWPLV